MRRPSDSLDAARWVSPWVSLLAWCGYGFLLLPTLVVVPLSLGLPAAYSIARGSFPGKNLVTMFLLSPVMVPVIVVALGMYFYFSRLHIVGTSWSLILGHAAYTTPFVVITCLGGMRQIDVRIETAATVMG